MEINFDAASNVNLRSVEGVRGPRPKSKAAESASLQGTAGVQSAFENTPDIRAEEVERGKALFNSPKYPPQAVIRGLSRLLALGVSSPDDQNKP
ncbi:MAG TPA: hypothetical protein VGE41_07590 [Verrucomicrobiae bacterium]|jgi:hypothetical protein